MRQPGRRHFQARVHSGGGKRAPAVPIPIPIPNCPQRLPFVVARFGYQPPRVVCVCVLCPPPPHLNAQYYTELSASIATDAYFVSMMESAWMMAASVSEADAASILDSVRSREPGAKDLRYSMPLPPTQL